MDDQTAQTQNQTNGNVSTSTNQQLQQGGAQDQIAQAPKQPVSGLPNKEHAPLSEHVQITDPIESQPEVDQELKEAGVDARQDEARLDITREQQMTGVNHAPYSSPVSPHIEEPKAEFPMQYETAEEEIKKGSVWNSLRWLATLVVKQMKIKGEIEQK